MTKAEVEGIFGVTGNGWRFGNWPGITLAESDEIFRIDDWQADDGSSTHIAFVDDCVAEKRWLYSSETILGKIRRWLHLR